MTAPIITWGGLTLGGDGPYRIRSIEGWADLPNVRNNNQDRARAHGEHPGLQLASGRAVTVSGIIADRDNAEQLLQALDDATPIYDATLIDLAITDLGRTLHTPASLLRRAIPREVATGRMATWALQWQCPDPLRYGDEQNLTTGLPSAGAGLTYPLSYPLSYGAAGGTGQIMLTNPGNAAAPILFEVTGPLPVGYEISAGGQRILHPATIAAGQTVVIDTAAGTVLVEGTSNRRAELAWADWLSVPPGGSLTVQFAALDGSSDPAAQLSATWSETRW